MRQRSGAWELRVYLGRDAVTGRDRYATRTVRGPRREAERALARMLVDAPDRGPAATTTTLGELLERWFAQASADFSPKTVRETRGFLDRDVLPVLGRVPLARLQAEDLDAYYQRLRRQGSRGRPLAPATIRRIHGILRRALEQAVRWRWLAVNPAASASPPKVPKRNVRPPSPAALRALLDAADGHDPALAAFVHLAAATGARRSELIALRWSDVDLSTCRLTIERGIVTGPDGLMEKDTKTHQARVVTLDAATCAVLAAHQRRAADTARLLGTALDGAAFVFSADGAGREPWFPDSASRAFRRLCRRTGVDGVRLHDLRHYVATRLLASGVDVRTVAGRLGHRSPATTLNVYAHFVPSADAHAADVLADLLRRAPVADSGGPAAGDAGGGAVARPASPDGAGGVGSGRGRLRLVGGGASDELVEHADGHDDATPEAHGGDLAAADELVGEAPGDAEGGGGLLDGDGQGLDVLSGGHTGSPTPPTRQPAAGIGREVRPALPTLARLGEGSGR